MSDALIEVPGEGVTAFITRETPREWMELHVRLASRWERVVRRWASKHPRRTELDKLAAGLWRALRGNEIKKP